MFKDNDASKEEIQSFVEQLPFANTDGFEWNYGQSGTKNFTFGTRSGPVNTVSALMHELAHAVEFGARQFKYRTSEYDGTFVFSTPSRWCFDRFVCEPQTGEMTAREARAFAIEAHLLQYLGILKSEQDLEGFFEYVAEVAEFMPDWYFYMKDDGKEKLLKILRETHSAWTIDQIFSELNRWFLCVRRERLKERLSQQNAQEVCTA